MPTFQAKTKLPAPAARAFTWHERPGAFERLSPPWRPVQVAQRSGGIQDGGRVTLSIPVGPARVRWELVHKDFVAGRSFRDEQVHGPFRSWSHLHEITPDGTSSQLNETITWELPTGGLASALGAELTAENLAQLFAYRFQMTRDDLAAHERWHERGPLKVAITGASGLVGSALIPFLSTGGHEVVRLVRGSSGDGPSSFGTSLRWDPAQGQLDPEALEGVDAVVHLSGEGVADGRWTKERKHRIRESRVQSTRLVAETLARMRRKPRVLVCASAVGIYDWDARTPVGEDGPQGDGFLAEVVRAWEDACEPARQAGIRVVNTRIGMVLSPAGGALAKLLKPFKLGVGGPVGEGTQHTAWVALDDVVGAMHHALMDDGLVGPVNLTAPEPADNQTFSRTLGDVLGRPAVLPVPGAAIRLAFGEMADVILRGAPVVPSRLQAAGYTFRFPILRQALEHMLGRRRDLRLVHQGRDATLTF